MLARIARTSIDSSFADDDRRHELHGELEDFLATNA
jgi:adenosine deaminase